MKIGDRIKEIRKVLGLNQGKFAKRLKFSQGAISDFEANKKPIAEKFIQLICLEFEVSDVWLRTGKGEMFSKEASDIVSETVIFDEDGKLLNLEQKDRVKELRKSLKLNQAVFAEKLGIKNSALSRIETGENALTEQNIFLICSSYGVNELWLREGKGPMFNDAAIPGAKDLIDTYKELKDINRKLVLNHAHYLLDSQKIAKKSEKPVIVTEKGEKKSKWPDSATG